MSTEALLKLAPILAGLRAYHDHSIVGAKYLPEKTAAIIAVNHSLASYDIALLMLGIYEHINRIPRALIDRLFYKIPGMGAAMESLGSLEGNHDNAMAMLKAGEILVLAPGGMREALRPSTEKYKIIWGRRKGFVKLAIESGTPIILAACPAADDMYDIVPSHITAWAYKTLKIPLFFAKGLGLSPIPKAVKLTHYLSEPQIPPKMAATKEEFSAQVNAFHAQICLRMQRLLDEAVSIEKNAHD